MSILSSDFFDFFFAILVLLILSFDMSPLDMLSPLCAAGPVVDGALVSAVWAKAADDSSRAEAARGYRSFRMESSFLFLNRRG